LASLNDLREPIGLLDPQKPCELRLVVPHLLDEPLGVLAADEHVDRIAEDVLREELRGRAATR
jgi:hypothetical protein